MGLLMLDLDGTIVRDAIVEVDTATGTKLQRRQHELYTEPELLEGRYEKLKACAEEGDSFAIVTNQGGVSWGFHTQAECYRRISSTVGKLSCFWGRPFTVHVAFMHPKGTVPQFKGDDGRKPAPDMLMAAIGAHGFDPALTASQPVVMVGDRDEDQKAAEQIGVEFIPADHFFV